MDQNDSTEPEGDGPGAELLERFNHYAKEFLVLCQTRHEAGAAEYGQFSFVGNDVIRMMAEELADTANYCRMQFIKLMILNEVLINRVDGETDESGKIDIGAQAFKGTKKGWKKHD